jgi:hypothetical protein
MIADLKFLFHKSGPLKGQPRGYAFVEYAQAEVRSPMRDAHHRITASRALGAPSLNCTIRRFAVVNWTSCLPKRYR